MSLERERRGVWSWEEQEEYGEEQRKKAPCWDNPS